MEKYIVKILKLSSGENFSAEIVADEGETSDNVILSAEIGGKKYFAKEEYYLDAYMKFRDELLSDGFGLQCCGSLINANQSSMMAQSYTPQVYLIELGRPARMKDIAGIWDHCDITDFPTSSEQREYTEKWYGSLR